MLDMMKRILAPCLVLMMTLLMPMAASAAELPILTIQSDIYGDAFTNGYSTQKAEDGTGVVYAEDSSAVFTLLFADGTPADDSLIDASEAKITLLEGDGYYPTQLILRADTLSNAWVDGETTYMLTADDLVWSNGDYPVDNGGREWSGIGGDGSGRYTFNFGVSGIKYDGQEIADATFRVWVYSYGREFSGGTNGAAGYDELMLPEADFRALENEPEAAAEPVWTWVGEGTMPILCDYLADDFYITWPEGMDASDLTAADVIITLHSEYGDVLTLAPGSDFELDSSENETQIALTLVYWPFAPVYTHMEIIVDADDLGSPSASYDIASVYTHMVQTGGGMDRDLTVVAYNFLGIENLIAWEQVVTPATYMYAYKSPDAGARDPWEYYYAEDASGMPYITENAEEAMIYDANGPDERNLVLEDHTVFITGRVADPMEITIDGEDYTLTKAYSGGKHTARLCNRHRVGSAQPLALADLCRPGVYGWAGLITPP